ncbi:hypothetical protein F5878DRAFT_529862 [Lentinula raphanica]|uniref:Uncharacterized protein n=1 Tax=Lentinula raphanica TaxID=153919 RepID=A0AA38UKZ4_9AGAR|nr:hypothetical protein F5878DRAFT_529862 [Lentinula raphanica]
MEQEKEAQERKIDEQIKEVAELQEKNDKLVEEKERYQRENHSLKEKVRRVPTRLETAMKKVRGVLGVEERLEKTLRLKEKGVIPDHIRDTICDLVALDNVPAQSCVDAFKRITVGLGFDIEGNVSERSVNRIVKEGGVAAKLHVVESFQQAEGIAISSDGTSHKNNNYESHCVTTVDKTGGRKEFFLGISMAANHTSEMQRNEWIELIDGLYELFKSSPFCAGDSDSRDFWAAVTGMHTDHAEDQKKLFRLLKDFKHQCDREQRGEKTVLGLSSPELVQLLVQVSQTATEAAGGLDAWSQLTEAEQFALNEKAYLEQVREIGEDEFNKLLPDERENVDLFLWVGCCMHKEMNAFKAGVTEMESWWAQNNIEPPTQLPNRDNDAASTLAPGTAAAARANEKSKGGAIKVTTLAGTVFRHKDRKRGQQDTLRFYFDKQFGFTIEFPDTSNSRFQSHAQASAILITYLDFFLGFLDLIEDNKTSRQLNHLEKNVRCGLQCNKTRHELAAITLYHQTISVPYMREIRGPLSTEQNVLNLGPFHEQLKAHLRKLVAHPELAVGPDISYETATFDGKLWDRPEAVYAVQRHLFELPYLRDLFAHMCSGALRGWERFTSEFADGGEISRTSAKLRQRASMLKTNDKNESEFGVFRREARDKPSMSLSQHNSRQMYKQNAGVSDYLHSMSGDGRQFLREQVRKEDGSGKNREKKMSIAQHMDNVAAGKRKKDKEKKERRRQIQEKVASAGSRRFADVETLENVFQIAPRSPGYLTVAELDLQLDWYAQNTKDSGVPKTKGERGTRDAKFELLKQAITRSASQTAQMDTGGGSGLIPEQDKCEEGENNQEMDAESDDSEEAFYGRSIK